MQVAAVQTLIASSGSIPGGRHEFRPCQRKRKHRMPREAHARRLQGSSRPREHEDRRKRFRPRRHSRADIPASGVPGRMAAGVLS